MIKFNKHRLSRHYCRLSGGKKKRKWTTSKECSGKKVVTMTTTPTTMMMACVCTTISLQSADENQSKELKQHKVFLFLFFFMSLPFSLRVCVSVHITIYGIKGDIMFRLPWRSSFASKRQWRQLKNRFRKWFSVGFMFDISKMSRIYRPEWRVLVGLFVFHTRGHKNTIWTIQRRLSSHLWFFVYPYHSP